VTVTAPLDRCPRRGTKKKPDTMCGRKSLLSGMVFDLEAFSHYSADGSFAALPCQTSAKTNYLNNIDALKKKYNLPLGASTNGIAPDAGLLFRRQLKDDKVKKTWLNGSWKVATRPNSEGTQVIS